MTSARRLTLLGAAAAAVAALTGCSAAGNGSNTNLVAGKELFVARCGSCHVLERAGTKGVVGPNLDHAFANPVAEGFGETAIRGMVRQQIALARTGGVMPAGLVKGQAAVDVASYVAAAVSAPGQKDTGLLATAGQPKQSKEPAIAKGGTLSIPADPNGQLLYVNATAEAPAGRLTIEMPNASSVLHDIVIDGKGNGQEVDNNGVSSFTADFAPGTYTYYCSLPGHRAAGMEGKLTVK